MKPIKAHAAGPLLKNGSPFPRLALAWSLAVLLCMPGVAFCEDDSDSENTIKNTIVVTATRSPQEASNVAANISVITAEEIEQLPVSTVAEALQFVPGVTIDFQGGPGSDASGISIHGSDTRHVAIYQDGVPLNLLVNSRTDLSSLPVENIERIEVYKGSASSAWGSALGGVVNIITKSPDGKRPVSTDATVSYGEYDTLKTRATVTGTAGRLGWSVSGTHEKSSGFMEYTDYRQSSGYGKLDYDLGKLGRVDLVAFFGDDQDSQPLPNYSEFWDHREQRRVYQRLAWEIAPADTLLVTAEVRHHQYDTRIDDVYATRRIIYNDYEDESWGASLKANWDIASTNTLSAGFDADWGDYDWVYYTDTYDTRDQAIWANDTATFGPLTVTAGLRYDDDLNFGSQVSPSAGAVYRFSRYQALLRAQAARGFSAPPAAWVNDPAYGNTDLDAETANTYQIGGEIQPWRFFKADATVFRADVDDLITWEAATNRFQNVDSVKRQGVEGGLTASTDFGLTLYFGGCYVDVFDTDTDERIQDIAKLTYTARVLYTGDRLSHTLVGRYIDHNSSYDETRDKRFVWDYKLMIRLPLPKTYGTAKLFFNIYNLTDSDYLYRDSRPKPGRCVEGGIQFVF